MTHRRSVRRAAVILAALALAVVAAACGDDTDDVVDDPTTEPSPVTPDEPDDADDVPVDDVGPTELVGTFVLDPGACDDAGVATGSYFTMVEPEGSVEEGPFIPNADSACADTTFTLLEPGSDGGIATGDHQPQPEPAFDDAGNGLADRIVTPTPFFGIAFAVSTNETDPQTGEDVPPLEVVVEDGSLTGDTRAFSVAYGNQHFNQGAPKPDGDLPGLTQTLTGTYDPDTGRFEMGWVSQIIGGPFNDFTGVWHFEGTFTPGDPS